MKIEYVAFFLIAVIIMVSIYGHYYDFVIAEKRKKKSIKECEKYSENGEISFIYEKLFMSAWSTFLICINQVWYEVKRNTVMRQEKGENLFHYPMYRVYSHIYFFKTFNYKSGSFNIENGTIINFFSDYSPNGNLKMSVGIGYNGKKYTKDRTELFPQYAGIRHKESKASFNMTVSPFKRKKEIKQKPGFLSIKFIKTAIEFKDEYTLQAIIGEHTSTIMKFETVEIPLSVCQNNNIIIRLYDQNSNIVQELEVVYKNQARLMLFLSHELGCINTSGSVLMGYLY